MKNFSNFTLWFLITLADLYTIIVTLLKEYTFLASVLPCNENNYSHEINNIVKSLIWPRDENLLDTSDFCDLFSFLLYYT